MKAPLRWIVIGFLFSLLWASASVATKIALHTVQPLVIAQVRFAIASAILLFIAHAILRKPLPLAGQWKQITVYGLLNITIYLGIYVVAMQFVTAGISALAVASNPVMISFLSIIFLRQKLTASLVLSLLICSAGVLCAAWPLLHTASVTPAGLWLILLSMVSYSCGALYFSAKKWEGLDLITINGWQTLIGGLCLLPFTLIQYHSPSNDFDRHFWGGVLWLAIPVSIVAVQLWMRLLKINPVRASLWLFLCPLFGFILSGWLLHEPITVYTVGGIMMVIAGLLITRMKRS